MAINGTKRKQHVALCSICNHEARKEIEEEYLSGTSPYQIELDYPGVPHKAVYKHAKIFGLDEKRDNTTLTKVRALIDRANVRKMKINEAHIPKLLELEAKLSGEMIERSERKNTNETTHDVSKSIARRMDRLINAVPGLREHVDGDKE